jgi:hypothetical protein
MDENKGEQKVSSLSNSEMFSRNTLVRNGVDETIIY